MARGQWGALGQVQPYGVRISWRTGTSVMQTGFHLRGATLELTNPAEVATDVADWVTTSFRTILGTTDQVMGIDVVNLYSREGASVSPANQFGTLVIGGAEEKSYVCVTANLKGELRTRYGQGRMFFPVRFENHTNGEVLHANGVAALQAVVTAMADRWIGNDVTGYNLVNVHGPIAERAATATTPARPAIPQSWYDVTSIRLNTALTFLRSRKAGVGS